MARDRLPGGFAIAQTVFHSLSIIACFASIVASGYAVNRNPWLGPSSTGRFVAALWATGLDLAEIAALADRQRKRVRRCPARFLYLLELLTAAFCFLLPLIHDSSTRARKCLDIPITDYEIEGCGSVEDARQAGRAGSVAVGAIFAAGAIHFILFIMNTIQYCTTRRKPSVV